MKSKRATRNLARREFLALAGALGLGGAALSCSPDSGDDRGDAADDGGEDADPGGGVDPAVGLARVPDPMGSIVTRWRADPFALGSYSFLAVGAEPEDRDLLAAPVADRLFFAGEATNRSFPATVHGALRSGEDAAELILGRGPDTVVVIGSGAAGLTAANRLVAAGVAVQVIEARDRIGGRTWTDDRLGVPLDLGASWIHGQDGNPLTGLADGIGAERVETDYDDLVVRNIDGAVVPYRETSQDFQDVAELEHEYAADVTDLSDEATFEGAEFSGTDVLFPGGYGPVIASLVDGFSVETGVVVESLAVDDDGVTVTAANRSFRADAALVTVPLGVLKAGSIAFDPPLDEDKRGAIDRLGMGLLNKVYLKFNQVFWDDVDVIGYLGPERGHFSQWFNLAKVTGEPILLGFNAASAADGLELLTDDEIVAGAMVAIRDMYQLDG